MLDKNSSEILKEAAQKDAIFPSAPSRRQGWKMKHQ